MTSRERARATTRRIRTRRIRAAGLLAVIAASAAALGYQSSASPSSAASSSASSTAAPPLHVLGSGRPGARGDVLGAADGAVPDDTTVFDGDVPGVANLDEALLRALRRAALHAANDAVKLHVHSGWRSPEYQERLLREAVTKYGSEQVAARWVATPTTSPHVSGEAVDLGPSAAAAWLSEHGAEYGLCQIYINEPWHYELRPEAVSYGCPPMYADPTHDPRMQR